MSSNFGSWNAPIRWKMSNSLRWLVQPWHQQMHKRRKCCENTVSCTVIGVCDSLCEKFFFFNNKKRKKNLLFLHTIRLILFSFFISFFHFIFIRFKRFSKRNLQLNNCANKNFILFVIRFDTYLNNDLFERQIILLNLLENHI